MKTIKIIADNIIFKAIEHFFSKQYQCVNKDNPDANIILIDDSFHNQAREIHKQHPKAPMVMLVEKGETQVDIPSFAKVIEKPLKMKDLKELIENLVIVVVVLGPFRIYPKTRQMVCIETDEKIPLTEKEIEIILFLRNKAGKVVSKEELLSSIWQYHPDITTHTLETHVYRLRKKLESYGITDFLVTKECGYSLEA